MYGPLYAVNPDGTEKWAFTAHASGAPEGGLIASSPTIGADGTIYIGSYDDNVYAVNPNGTEKWSFVTGGVLVSSAAVGADGTVYVGDVERVQLLSRA